MSMISRNLDTKLPTPDLDTQDAKKLYIKIFKLSFII